MKLEDPVSILVVKTYHGIFTREWTYGDICNGPTPLIGQSLHKLKVSTSTNNSSGLYIGQ
ncbi:hypothetical protein PIROE2DRAFT_14972 [Piromyces sp. E2]|nr:hypothetical protein PIROE2DRAFT_14972 [Piromyces sp. E2]|eukprot:OUM59493.1 hypothetical protein PIROE2DRAFT_14972 [Piromyces sp. E2]